MEPETWLYTRNERIAAATMLILCAVLAALLADVTLDGRLSRLLSGSVTEEDAA